MKLLSIDYSTQATGYAFFVDGKLAEWGVFTLNVVKRFKGYPFGNLRKLEDMRALVQNKIHELAPDEIVIEEINRGAGRTQQKMLDAGHFILLQGLELYEGRVHYMDSNGKEGWRPTLKLALTIADKELNKEIVKQNRKRQKGVGKQPKVNWKTLSVRWVNKTHNLGLCGDIDPGTAGDIADAICLGEAFLLKLKK